MKHIPFSLQEKYICNLSDIDLILNNQVLLFSPLEGKEQRLTVREIVFQILSELDAEEDANSYQSSLKGSSVTNLCVAPIYPVCNDIDLEIEYTKNSEDPYPFYLKIDAILKRAFRSLVGGIDGDFSWKQLNIVESPFTFLGPNHSYALYKIRADSSLEDKYLPLDIPVHFVSNSEVSRHTNNADSFYIPLRIFHNHCIGSYAENQYELLSKEGDCHLIVEQVRRGEITSKIAGVVNKFGWYRYLMAVTEWGASPGDQLNQLFYKNNASLGSRIIYEINRFIGDKRKFREYPLFLYINAIFHSPEESDVQTSVIENVMILLESPEEQGSSSSHALSRAVKGCPTVLVPVFLKLFVPSLADKVTIVDHLGKKQMRCLFFSEGKCFYLMVPFLMEDVLKNPNKCLDSLSNEDWKALFYMSKKDQKPWKLLFIWMVIHLPSEKSCIQQELLQDIWLFTNKEPLKNCLECFASDTDRFTYLLKVFRFLEEFDFLNAEIQLIRALNYPITADNQTVFKENMPPHFTYLNQLFERLLQKQEGRKACVLLNYYGEAFGYEQMWPLYAQLPDSSELDEIIIQATTRSKDISGLYFIFHTRDKVATAIERNAAFSSLLLQEKSESSKKSILTRIRKLVDNKELEQALALVSIFSTLDVLDSEVIELLKFLLQQVMEFPKRREKIVHFIETQFLNKAQDVLHALFVERMVWPLKPSLLRLFKGREDRSQEHKWISYFVESLDFNTYIAEEREEIKSRLALLIQTAKGSFLQVEEEQNLPSLLVRMLPYYNADKRFEIIKEFVVSLRGKEELITTPIGKMLSEVLIKSVQLQVPRNPWKLLFIDLVAKDSFSEPFIVLLSEQTKDIPLTTFSKIFSTEDKRAEHYSKAFKSLYRINPMAASSYWTKLIQCSLSNDVKKTLKEALPADLDLKLVFMDFFEQTRDPKDSIDFLQKSGDLLGHLSTIPFYPHVLGLEKPILDVFHRALQEETQQRVIPKTYQCFYSLPIVADFIEENHLFKENYLVQELNPVIFGFRIQKTIDQRDYEKAKLLFRCFSLLEIDNSQRMTFLRDSIDLFKKDPEKRARLTHFIHLFFKEFEQVLFGKDPSSRYRFLLELLQTESQSISLEEKEEFLSLLLREIDKKINNPSEKLSLLNEIEGVLIELTDQDKFQIALKCFGVHRKSQGTAALLFKKVIPLIQDLKLCFEKNPQTIDVIKSWIELLEKMNLDSKERVLDFFLGTKSTVLNDASNSVEFSSFYLTYVFKQIDPLSLINNDLEFYAFLVQSTPDLILSPSFNSQLIHRLLEIFKENISNVSDPKPSLRAAYLCLNQLNSFEGDFLWVSQEIGEYVGGDAAMEELSSVIASQSGKAASLFLLKLSSMLDSYKDKEDRVILLTTYLKSIDRFQSSRSNMKNVLLFVSNYLMAIPFKENSLACFECAKVLIRLHARAGDGIYAKKIIEAIYLKHFERVKAEEHLSFFIEDLLDPIIVDNPPLCKILLTLDPFFHQNKMKERSEFFPFFLHLIEHSATPEDSQEWISCKIQQAYRCIKHLSTGAAVPLTDLNWLLKQTNVPEFRENSVCVITKWPDTAMLFLKTCIPKFVHLEVFDAYLFSLLTIYIDFLMRSNRVNEQFIEIVQCVFSARVEKDFNYKAVEVLINVFVKEIDLKSNIDSFIHLIVLQAMTGKVFTEGNLDFICNMILKESDFFTGKFQCCKHFNAFVFDYFQLNKGNCSRELLNKIISIIIPIIEGEIVFNVDLQKLVSIQESSRKILSMCQLNLVSLSGPPSKVLSSLTTLSLPTAKQMNPSLFIQTLLADLRVMNTPIETLDIESLPSQEQIDSFKKLVSPIIHTLIDLHPAIPNKEMVIECTFHLGCLIPKDQLFLMEEMAKKINLHQLRQTLLDKENSCLSLDFEVCCKWLLLYFQNPDEQWTMCPLEFFTVSLIQEFLEKYKVRFHEVTQRMFHSLMFHIEEICKEPNSENSLVVFIKQSVSLDEKRLLLEWLKVNSLNSTHFKGLISMLDEELHIHS